MGPIDGEHWKLLLASDWMAMDATGLKVCIKDVPGTHSGYLEAFHNKKAVVMQYESTKHSEPLVNRLASFSGILVADAEHRHNPLFKDGRIIEAGCNAHGRRKLRDAEQHQPVLAPAQFTRRLKPRRNPKLGLTGDALRA